VRQGPAGVIAKVSVDRAAGKIKVHNRASAAPERRGNASHTRKSHRREDSNSGIRARAMYLRCHDSSRRFGQNSLPETIRV
jgi:hypothetical protein